MTALQTPVNASETVTAVVIGPHDRGPVPDDGAIYSCMKQITESHIIALAFTFHLSLMSIESFADFLN